jgi:hypothetical protein
MTGLLELMAREGLVSLVEIEADLLGWRLSPSAVRLVPGEAIRAGEAQGNRYFHDLYNAIATDLKRAEHILGAGRPRAYGSGFAKAARMARMALPIRG